MQKILGSFPPDPQSQGGLCQRLCQITNAEIPWRSGLTKGPPESDVTPELCPKGATSVLRGEQNTSDHKLPRRVIFVLFYFAFCSSTFLLSTKAMFFFNPLVSQFWRKPLCSILLWLKAAWTKLWLIGCWFPPPEHWLYILQLLDDSSAPRTEPDSAGAQQRIIAVVQLNCSVV